VAIGFAAKTGGLAGWKKGRGTRQKDT